MKTFRRYSNYPFYKLKTMPTDRELVVDKRRSPSPKRRRRSPHSPVAHRRRRTPSPKQQHHRRRSPSPSSTKRRHRSPSRSPPRRRRRSTSPSTIDANKHRDETTKSLDDKKKTEQTTPVDLLRSKTGGAYIPPAKLKQMQEQIANKNSEQYQRMNWERIKKKIHGQVNKVNVGNIVDVVRELLQENIIRGK